MEIERREASDGAFSEKVARAVFGLLLIWTGAALLLHWSWGVGLLGAGVILLGAQAARASARVKVDGFGLVAGLVLVACGVGSLLDVAIALIPLLCIAAGIAVLVPLRSRRPAGPGGLHAHSHPRA